MNKREFDFSIFLLYYQNKSSALMFLCFHVLMNYVFPRYRRIAYQGKNNF